MKQRIRIGLVVIICLVVLWVGVPRAIHMWLGRALPPPDAAQLKNLEELMELRLPPSARPVAWTYRSWLGYNIFLKVEIDPSDLQALIQDSPFAGIPLSSKEHRFYCWVGGSWWDDGEKAQQFLFGETRFPQGQQYPDRHLQVMVDMDREDVYVVYLMLTRD